MDTIILEKITKDFKIGYKEKENTLNHFVSLFSGKNQKKTLSVLKNISFSVKEGEVVGVIGNNGSGKTTLLRIIAGIYSFDSGKLITKGKIVSLINLGAGLKERLTMRDNIYLLGALFGMDRKNIKEELPKIVKFSGLKDFLDTQVYQFSQGMIQRLVFSVAVFADPKILLLDEVFEIGDEDFKKRSAAKINELMKNGATALLVSHDMDMIEKYCSNTLWLSGGHLKNYGKTKIIIRKYIENERKSREALS